MGRYLSVCVAIASVITLSCVEREPSVEQDKAAMPALDPAVEREMIERLTTTNDGVKIAGKLMRLDCSGGDPTITTNDWPIHVIRRPDGKGGQLVDKIACDEGAEFTYEPPIMFVFCPVPGSPPSRP